MFIGQGVQPGFLAKTTRTDDLTLVEQSEPTATTTIATSAQSSGERERRSDQTDHPSGGSQIGGDDSDGDNGSDSDNSEEASMPNPDIPSHLLKVLGIETHQIQSFGKDDAAELASKVHDHLKLQSDDSVEYASMVKTLQDLCTFSGKLPASYELSDVIFDRRDVIGRGGEAVVYRGRMNDQNIVIREMLLSPRQWRGPVGQKVIQLIHREAIIHSLLKHQNILPFLGLFHETAASPPIFILPFRERGALSDFILDKPIVSSDFGRIVIGIARGVEYLHSRTPPIVHGDLHPGNILLDDAGDACICDFGLTRIRHEVTRTWTMIHEGGHLRFLAPELTSGVTQRFRTTQTSDIFTFSMTLLNTWTQQPPFSEIRNEARVAASLRKGHRPNMPIAPINLGPEVKEQLWSLLTDMWVHEPSFRPSAQVIRQSLERILLSFL